MSKSFQIRWHSRAGQGAITAANALTQIALQAAYYSQSFPEFGAEKRGAAVKVFNRISSKPIKLSTEIEEPDLVVLLDPTLINHELSYEDVLEGLKKDGTLIINSSQQNSKFDQLFQGTVRYLDASTIAKEYLKLDLPNLPMLAVLIKVLKIDYQLAYQELNKILQESFPEKIVQANLQAFQIAYEKFEA